MDDVWSAKTAVGDTLIACGEYKSKGSLELYGLSSPLSDPRCDSMPAAAPRALQSSTKNRQTSSSSKLLSVTPHGSRLVFTDANGNVKWVERDGFTEVRHWNIQHASTRPRGVSYAPDDDSDGDIVRKILPTRRPGSRPAVNADNLLLWTGEKIGMLRFTGKPGVSAVDYDEAAGALEESHQERAERTYGEEMQRALRAQADEVRLMSSLGMPHA